MSFMSVPKLLSPTATDSFVINDGKKLYYDLEDLRRSLAQEDDEAAFEDERQEEEHFAEFAPPEHQWYHGVLDRPGAEKRLQGTRAGTYLVRESEGKPGSYSLSYMGRHGFDHFRIICAYGQYYIGGRQFESLGDLIGYYTHKSYILVEQKLEFPLPPEARILETQQDPHEGRPWFFSGLSKHHATSYVQSHGTVGSFLIRPSEAQGNYSLMVHIGDNTVQRYRVRQDFQFFNIGGKPYESLDDIISHYRQCQIATNVYLMEPVVKTEEYITLESGSSKAAGLSSAGGTISKEGYLTKKVGQSKKWKDFYFSLKVAERHLLFFENEKSSHPKGLIDLNFCNLYNVHESLHGRSNCFQLVIRSFAEVSSFFLCCQSREDKQEWMTVLEPLCVNAERTSQKGTHMEMCNIRLTVLDSQKLPKNASRPYCLISLNDVAVAKTTCSEGSAPSIAWDEDFVFSNLSKEISTLAIVMLNKHKRVKDTVVGKVSVDLTQLPNRTTTEDWYELKPHDKSGKNSKVNLGTLRLRVQYQCDVVLPEAEYLPLQELLLAEDMQAITCLGEVVKDRRSLIGSVMKIFTDCPSGIRTLLKNLAQKEICAHEDPATLFRSNSVASTAIDEYMKSVAMPFLHSTVKTMVNDIITSNPHCELDPNRLEKGEDVAQNLTNLTKLMDQMLERIFSSSASVDKPLQEVFCTLQSLVKERFPDQEAVRTRVVAGFFFLRFICLALVNPRLFNLTSNQPPERASRTLTLIAKGLQNLASLVEFGAKEPYMTAVNPFISKYRQGMVDFVDKISVSPGPFERSTSVSSLTLGSLPVSGSAHRELANLVSLSFDYLPEMKKASQSDKPTARVFAQLMSEVERLHVTAQRSGS